MSDERDEYLIRKLRVIEVAAKYMPEGLSFYARAH